MAVRLKPWSYSSLDLFKTCPRKFHAERITKEAVDEETAAKTEGLRVHKAFEDRLGFDKRELPEDMQRHEFFMQEIENAGGHIEVERKVGLNKHLEPCGFFDPDVWWRGVIDMQQIHDNGHVRIVDYKTGKPHKKMEQLKLFSIYAIAEGATQVESMLYWTRDGTRTKLVMPAMMMGAMLASFVPDLEDYIEAHKLDIWSPKRNYLCRNYCAVNGCEYLGKGMFDR